MQNPRTRVNLAPALITSKTTKIHKLKKDALDPVDIESESKKDPKYKTEYCTNFMNNSFCAYGNKCRFAHGKEELFQKKTNVYMKNKKCKNFHKDFYCNYGNRCQFKHDERNLKEIRVCYYSYFTCFIKSKSTIEIKNPRFRRLPVFEFLSIYNYQAVYDR